jgi:mannosyltransferase
VRRLPGIDDARSGQSAVAAVDSTRLPASDGADGRGDRTRDPAEPMSRGVIALLLGCLILGAALRFHQIGRESVWLDEAFSIEIARTTLANIVHQTSADVHPPLYYFALAYWLPIAGNSEGPARALSTLFDLLTILAAFAVAQRLLGRRAAALTAVLLSISRFHVEFAQEARMYAMLALFSTLSMHAFIVWVQARRRAALVWYVLATSVMTYTQVYSVFILAAQAAIVGWLWRRDRADGWRVAGPWLAAVAVVIVLFSPWLAILVTQVRRVQQTFWIPAPHWYSIFQPLLTYSGSVALTFVFVPLAIIGLWRLRRRATRVGPGSTASPLLFIVPWFLAPIVLPLAASVVGSPIFLPKYSIAASIPFALFVAYGLLDEETGFLKKPGFLASVAIGVLTAVCFREYFGVVRKDAWREAVAVVEARAQPGDLVLFYRWFNRYPFDFYRRRTDLEEAGLPLTDLEPTLDEIRPAVAGSLGAHDRVWFVVLQGEQAKPAILKELGDRYTEIDHQRPPHLDVYLFTTHP